MAIQNIKNIKGRIKALVRVDGFSIYDEEGFICGTLGTNEEKLKALLHKVNDSIQLKNIDLTGISLVQELVKREEEYRELTEAIIQSRDIKDPFTREHLLEEACDNIQVVLSVLKVMGIDIQEFIEYWNSKHLEKLPFRPR